MTTCPSCSRHTCADRAVCRNMLAPSVAPSAETMNPRCLVVAVPLGLAMWAGIWWTLSACGVVG